MLSKRLQDIQNFQFFIFYELEKIWKYTQPKKTRPTFRNPNFEFMDELGKVIS